MAKQTFTTGQVLTAAQMTSLQQTAMLGGNATAKTISYTLVAADAGTTVAMSNAGATTITVNTSLFEAGDIVTIYNQGAGVCTITAGTATVNTSGSLVLAQYQGGVLYFISASAAVFFQFATPSSPGDITAVNAGTGISGGGTSGDVTITNSMATAITTSGDLIQGTGSGTFARLGIGTNGQVLSSNGTSATWTTPSTGAITWTQRIAGDGIGALTQIAYNGSNLYVAVGSAGKLYSSTDAKTWTSRTSGFGANNIYDVVYGAGIWVAVGDNGTITTSTDGITWTARTSNMSTNIIYSVVFANSLFVAVGDGGGLTNTGGIAYSSDGITWTRKSQTVTIGTTYTAVAWNGTNWVVGANTNTNNYLYASTPSGTWTAGATGNTGTISAIYWDGTRHLICENGTIYYSTSTTIGTTTGQSYSSFNGSTTSTSAKQTLKYYSNVLYRAGMGLSSCIPVSNNYPTINNSVLIPTTYINAAGAFTSSAANLFIGAVGYIVGDNQGRIYTSF